MTVVALTARRTSAVAMLTLFAAYLGAELVRQPLHIRFIAAACLGLLAVVGATQWPRATLIAALALLPFLAFGRRLLLEFTPWKLTDPVLLVVPAVLMIALIRLYVIERRSLEGDRISKLLVFLVALTFLQVFNPRGGGLHAGAAALLFTAVPLLWFFAGHELATRSALRALFGCLVVSACLIALYGLYQTWYGMPSWDLMWVAQADYAALVVGGGIRAFGTFSSSAEYASFIAVAILAAIAFALDRRPYLLPAVPLLAIALFYESSRGIIVTTVVAALVVVAARTGSMRRADRDAGDPPRRRRARSVFSRGALQSAASSSSDGLVTHQLGGFAHPLSEKDSTLSLHLSMLEDGFRKGCSTRSGTGSARRHSRGPASVRLRRARRRSISRTSSSPSGRSVVSRISDPRPRAESGASSGGSPTRRGVAHDPRDAGRPRRAMAERRL